MLCLLLPSGFVPYVCDKLAKVCVCCGCCYLQVLFHVCVISWPKFVLCLLLPSGFVPYVCDKLAKVSVCCVCCYLQVLFHVCVISWPKSVVLCFLFPGLSPPTRCRRGYVQATLT